MIKKGIIILILLYAKNLWAQNLEFKTYTINQGLSQSVVNAIIQDKDGFIWVGTQVGLNRFDGYRFKKYIHNPIDNKSLSNNWIYAICEDEKNNLWIGTRVGLNKLNKTNDSITRYKSDPNDINSLASDYIYGMTIDKFRNILVLNTPSYLNIFNIKTGKSKRFKYRLNLSTEVEDRQVPVIIDKNGLIWAATSGGVACFNLNTEKFNYITSDNGLSNNNITTIYEDNNDNIWIGTRNGLNRLDKNTNAITIFRTDGNNSSISGSYIQSITGKGNTLWIGTQTGLNKTTVSRTEKTVFSHYRYSDQYSNTLSSDFVLSLLVDKSDMLWVGTLSALDKADLKPKKFQLYRKSNQSNSVDLAGNTIASIFQDKKGFIWIGNWGKGLNVIDRKTNKVTHYTASSEIKYRIPNDFVHFIFEDSKNRIWLGTADGICLWSEKEKRFVSPYEYFNNNKIPDLKGIRINCFIEDSKNNIWIGSRNGLCCINKNFEIQIFKSERTDKYHLSDNLVYSVIETKDKKLWIATPSGIDIYNPELKSFEHIKNDPKSTNTLCDNFVASLHQDRSGNIWIGTQTGVNLYETKTKKFKYFTENEGFVNSTIYEIKEDNEGNIWFGTGRGLIRYDIIKKNTRIYGLEDNLQSLEFNLKAAYKSKTGEMFFGGMNGFNSFFPDSLKVNKHIPPICITGFEKENNIGKQTLYYSGNEEIVLEHGDFSFMIEFAALDYTDPEKNQFAYKLEGASNKWINIGNRRFVQFTNLASGSYIFRVKGSNNDQLWNEHGTSIRIRVKPPWWADTKAYLVYIIIFMAFAGIYIKKREQNLIAAKSELEKKVSERTFEIEQQKEEILAQHDEIQAQRDLATRQRDQIIKQNKAITDSIRYAKRIQKALLPHEEIINECFPSNFVFFLPKDIVSGDFYLIKKIEHHLVIAVADCTGHGVPGAFMSMLGISMLNEILRHTEITTAGASLEELRNQIKSVLQSSGRNDIQDGMDIALGVLDQRTKIFEYSGVNNPVILIRNREIIELHPIKNPFGIYLAETFSNQSIQLQSGDNIFLYSDGFYSQFGGEKGRKYMQKRFKTFLLSIADLPASEQKTAIENEFNIWKRHYDQVDDVLVIGLKIE